MKVYVVMVCDRHDDPEPHLFTNLARAIDYAHVTADVLARGAEVKESVPEEWHYLAEIGEEGDSVWVVEKELHTDEDGSAPR